MLAHGVTLAVATVTALAMQGQGTLAMLPMLLWMPLPLIGFSWVSAWRNGWGQGHGVALNLQSDGQLEYHYQDGSIVTAHVESESTVMPWLVILLLRSTNGQRISLVLLPDAVASEDFRRLRLWLRWRAKDGNPAISATG